MYITSDFSNDPKVVKKIIDDWLNSNDRKLMVDAKAYYNSNNTTISAIKKEIAVKRTAEKDGMPFSYIQTIENPYVSNNKIIDGFVQDMIDQKVYTLLGKTPTIDGIKDTTFKLLNNKMDFILQELSVEASICGVSFGFVETGDNNDDFNIKVFESENCIAFRDEFTDEVTNLIRFWDRKLSKTTIRYIEVYDNVGIKRYISSDNKTPELKESQSYRSIVKKDALSTVEQGLAWDSGLPIIELSNNKKRTSDFTRAIKSKVDIIDITMSDFANNLQDFQDIFWLLKGVDSADAENFGEFMDRIKTTYQAMLPEGVDAVPTQVDIPYEAKRVFVEEIRKSLIENAGVIDTKTMTGGSLTNVAVKAATQKLLLRVSKFEYFVYNAALRICKFAQEYLNDNTGTDTISIKFNRETISNDSELIQNLSLSVANISQRTYLENHPYVEDVERELERIKEESMNSFTLEGTNGQSTQVD